MRKGLLISLIVLAGWAAASEPPTTAAMVIPAGEPAGDTAEGLRVATRVGCNGCHGADAGGRELWEAKGEYKLFAPNLTEKRDLYSDAGIDGLLRQGRTHDGHTPFGMPIMMFQHLSDREVRDITAWLRSMPAVSNPDLETSWFADEIKQQIKDGTHPFLDDLRPDPGNRPPAEPPTETLAWGRHLAMTSCPECHGPDLNGFPGDDAPPLIIAKAYSPENFARLMKTGITASGEESATGLMTQMGRKRFAAMTGDEIHALKAYLDSR